MVQPERRIGFIMSDRDARILDGIAAQNDKNFEEGFIEILRKGVGILQQIADGKRLFLEENGRRREIELITTPPRPQRLRR